MLVFLPCAVAALVVLDGGSAVGYSHLSYYAYKSVWDVPASFCWARGVLALVSLGVLLVAFSLGKRGQPEPVLSKLFALPAPDWVFLLVLPCPAFLLCQGYEVAEPVLTGLPWAHSKLASFLSATLVFVLALWGLGRAWKPAPRASWGLACLGGAFFPAWLALGGEALLPMSMWLWAA